VKACKFIRIEKGNSSLRIVAITAYDDETKKREVLEAGANLYLTKPIDPGDLLEQVKKAISGSGESYPEPAYAHQEPGSADAPGSGVQTDEASGGEPPVEVPPE
jgi:DNA-binding response OmpR family regulator